MFSNETVTDARQRLLEKAYEDALRYALTYRTGWKELEEAAVHLRAFHAELAGTAAKAA